MQQVCSNCLQTRDSSHFQDPTRSYKTCDRCRNNRKRKRDGSSTLDGQSQQQQQQKQELSSVPLVPLATLHEHFVAATAHQQEEYCYEVRIMLDDTWLAHTDTDLAKRLCATLGECDGYRYILKTVNPSTARKGVASFYANCSQSLATAKASAVSTTARRRHTKQRKRFDCKGRISATIDRISRHVYVLLQHGMRHELPEPSRKTPPEIRELIRREELRGKSARNIYTDVQQQFPNTNITQAQVYYWWREFKIENEQAAPTPSTTATTTPPTTTITQPENNTTTTS
ncbi:predicted protein [Lichtheimia corymbifera JMRC:FSU:9682]|uniref:Uncharacterized protein n=1 Tax=Lichtheimia corymbifera JMRC:FSU:9682 TaxID=1263082 RepID=A0A068S9E5_9FUNG|nr:predicted protein [Lichtheimia corymbifera JMRC:FSU:9682]